MSDLNAFFPTRPADDGDDFWAGDAKPLFGPIEPGEYAAEIVKGELFTSAVKGTPGYRILFKIEAALAGGRPADSPHVGQMVGRDVWLTPAARAMSRPLLAKLGIVNAADLKRPLTRGMVARIRVGFKRGDAGGRSEVTDFTVVGRRDPTTPTPVASPDLDSQFSPRFPVGPPAAQREAQADPFAPPLTGEANGATDDPPAATDDHGDAYEPPADRAPFAPGWRPDLNAGPYGRQGDRR